MSFTPEQNKIIADLIFPNVHETIDDLEKRFPQRQLPEGAAVTRVAPSPTGFVHLGLLYTALICSRVSVQSGGVFYLRIEDTDQKRSIPGTIELIITALRDYGINIDEGPLNSTEEKGNYGPYMQSKRASIYDICTKHLILQGLAYPCFLTAAEIEAITADQTQRKLRPGIYGHFARDRHASAESIIEKLRRGDKYEVIRFRNPGSEKNRRNVVDLVKGKMQLPENDNDIVLMKSSDGLPVYHLAHAVDDHFMRSTHIIRGDEWLASMILHHQLFEAFNWSVPQYAHLGPIDKLDNGNRRKLSKRKDPEANVFLYAQQGYLVEAVMEYLMNIANSNFEDWQKAHPTLSYQDFDFNLNRLGKSGALVDVNKIENIGKQLISKLSADEVYEQALTWAKKYGDQSHPELAKLMEANKKYVTDIFGIERGTAEQRKDIAKWSDVYEEIKYFFDDIFANLGEEVKNQLLGIPHEIIQKACDEMVKRYKEDLDKETWLNTVKDIAESLGYAREVKLFKEHPEQFKGHFGDIAKIYRVLLTGRNRSPDLYWVMKIMGADRITKRLTAMETLR